MRLHWLYNIPFVGKKTLVERLLLDLVKRKKAYNRAFKAQRKKGKLTSITETSAYTALAELISYVEGVVREARERVRLYELPRDEQIFEIYGVRPRVLTPAEAEKRKAAVADDSRRHLLLQLTYAEDAERRRN